MQEDQKKQEKKISLPEKKSLLPQVYTASSRAKHTARFLLPAVALFVTAGAAYGAHSLWDETTQAASVQLRSASPFVQNMSSVRPAQQFELRFALTDNAAEQQKSASTVQMFAVNTPKQKQAATGLYVDGTFVGAVTDSAKLQTMLNTLLANEQVSTGGKNAVFLSQMKLVPGEYDTASIVTDDAMQVLLSGEKAKTKTYTVAKGDTADSIAKKNGLTPARLAEVNLGTNMKTLQPGDVIQLEPRKKLVSIKTVGSQTVSQALPYAKKTVSSASLYQGQTTVQTKGANGKKTTTYQITYVDGIETARSTSAVQTANPVDEVTAKGTKVHPVVTAAAGTATGSFLWPVPTLTSITSGYAARWGKFHYGLDISGSDAMGQPIYAADGGTVQVAGYDEGGYGNYIMIDHGNGFCSIYGHASKLLVAQGAKVAQGQLIALVGSTGHSTGAHCHFEVHKNGEKIDPTNLVNADSAKAVSYLGQKLTAEQITAMSTAAQNTAKTSLASYQKSATVLSTK
ncbi:MAG: M23 family metallopeptidase [Oscillospiraceae bacterium]|jgi:murein DD-endopeptidase MepM/ murein hydrolase activator NlpD|nr:M23 family metallopeptidase [Oscillospiraceae bacterium]